jgi:hypothetical protein
LNLAGVALSRWRMVANATGLRTPRTRASRGRSGAGLPRTLLLVGGAGGLVFAGLDQPFARLHALGVGAGEAGVALALALGAAVAALILFGIEEAVGALLLDPDLPLLRSAPLTPASMLGIKLLDAFPRTSVPLVTIALPAVVAWARHYPLPAWSWPLVPGGLLLLWMTTLGLGVALTLPLLRVVPAARVRSLVSLLSSLVAPLVWVASWAILPRLDALPTSALEAGRMFTSPALAPAWSPATWLARALSAAAQGRGPAALVSMAPLVLCAILSFALAHGAATALLEGSQARALTQGGPGRGARRVRSGRSRRRAPATAVPAMVLRDARLLLRDGAALGDSIAHVVIWGVMPLLGLAVRSVRSAEMVPVLLLSLAVGTGGHLASKSVPLERDALAWVRLAPVRATRWIAAKLLSGFLLAGPVAVLYGMALAAALGVPPARAPGLALLAASALGLSLATGIWLGVTFGDPRWTQPQLALRLAGRLLAIALALGQIVLWAAVAMAPTLFPGTLPPGFALWAPPLLAAALGLIPLAASASRLRGNGPWS